MCSLYWVLVYSYFSLWEGRQSWVDLLGLGWLGEFELANQVLVGVPYKFYLCDHSGILTIRESWVFVWYSSQVRSLSSILSFFYLDNLNMRLKNFGKFLYHFFLPKNDSFNVKEYEWFLWICFMIDEPYLETFDSTTFYDELDSLSNRCVLVCLKVPAYAYRPKMILWICHVTWLKSCQHAPTVASQNRLSRIP